MGILNAQSKSGRLARKALKLIPRRAMLPVLTGPNRGFRWIVEAGTHGCWVGTYERQELKLFTGLIGPGDLVWDVGAHAGYFALASSRLARQVVACEAAPTNAARLRKHITVNAVRNVLVVESAICADHGGSIRFGGEDSYQGQIGAGNLVVQTATIDGLVAKGLPVPSIIKMDIEGAEAEALKGARATLTNHRPTILLAVHSDMLRSCCSDMLEQAGYVVRSVNVGTLLARHAEPLAA